MIKSALEFLINLKKDPVVLLGDKQFNCSINNNLNPILESTQAEIKTQTLTSLIDYLSLNPDKLDLNKLYVVVKNQDTVYLESTVFGDFKQKEVYLNCHYEKPERRIESFINLEQMLIMLNSTFKPNDDLQNLIKILSRVSENDVKETEDDGVSQTVKIKSGIELQKEKNLPKLISLIPYMTFPEIDQPQIDYLLRARKGSYELEYALFTADGGAWKNRTILDIKDWISNSLEKAGLDYIPILA